MEVYIFLYCKMQSVDDDRWVFIDGCLLQYGNFIFFDYPTIRLIN